MDGRERDREVALHLMFLAGYGCTERPCLAGFDEDRLEVGAGSAGEVFVQVYEDLDRRSRLIPSSTKS
jgi:hypothetical protein